MKTCSQDKHEHRVSGRLLESTATWIGGFEGPTAILEVNANRRTQHPYRAVGALLRTGVPSPDHGFPLVSMGHLHPDHDRFHPLLPCKAIVIRRYIQFN
jgi:hypothetical protein